MTFLHNITSMFLRAKRPIKDQALAVAVPSLPAKPVTSKLVKPLLTVFLAMTGCSFLTFSSINGSLAQTTGTSTGPVAPASRRVTAALVTPSAAFAYYGTGTVHTNGQGHWTNYAPEIRALARGLGANRLSADAYATNVGKYVRDNIETEFRFGLGKGARGAVIDQSGTAFDQAELMVKLLRSGGVAASFQVGTITLTADQFGKWSGLVTSLNEGAQTFTVNANAACRFLADGGVPATVNGASSCTGLSGNLTTVTLAHVWVLANGKWYDPAYKAHKLYAGIDIPAAMGCGTTANNQCGDQVIAAAMTGATTGTLGGADTVSGINSAAIETRLSAQALALQNSLETNKPDAKLIEVVGGKDILTTGAFDSSSGLPYSLSNVSTFAGDVPNQYRSTVTVAATTTTAERGSPTTFTLFVDEVSGRKLQMYLGNLPVADTTTTLESVPQRVFYLDGVAISRTSLPPTDFANPNYGLFVWPSYLTLSVKLPSPSSVQMGIQGAQFQATSDLNSISTNAYPDGGRTNIHVQLGRSKRASNQIENETGLPNMNCRYDCGGNTLTETSQKFSDAQTMAASIVGAAAKSVIEPIVTIGVVQRHKLIQSSPAFGVSLLPTESMNTGATVKVVSAAGDLSTEAGAFKAFTMWQAELETITSSRGRILPARPTTSNFFSENNNSRKMFFGVKPNSYSTVGNYLNSAAPKQKYASLSAAGDTLIIPGHYSSFMCETNPRHEYVAGYYCGTIGGELSFSEGSERISLLGAFKGGAGLSASVPKLDAATIGKRESGFGHAAGLDAAFQTQAPLDLMVGPKDSPGLLALKLNYSSASLQREEYFKSRIGPVDYYQPVDYDEVFRPMGASTGVIGGGWERNFYSSAAISGASAIMSKNLNAIFFAREIVTTINIIEMRRKNDLKSIVISFLALNWNTDQLQNNLVSVSLDGQSISFYRLPNGEFRATNGIAEGTLSVPLIVWDPKRARYKYEGMTIVHKDRSGTVYEFSVAPKQLRWDCPVLVPGRCEGRAWMVEQQDDPEYFISSIRAASGVVTNFEYQWHRNNGTSDTDLVDTKKLPYLSKVSTNLGTWISLQYETVAYGSQLSGGGETTRSWTLSERRLTGALGSNGQSIGITRQCNQVPLNILNCNEFVFTRPDGSQLKYDYRPSAAGGDSPQSTDSIYRPRYLLRRWYMPRDQATAVQSIKYDELGRVASVTTRNSNNSTSTENVYVGGVFSGETERRVDQVNAAGGVNTDYYDSRGQAIRTVDEVGVAARYEYDGLGRVVTAFFEESAGASFKAGCMAAKGSRSNCWRTEYEYDARGNVTKETKYPYAWEGDYWWGWVEITEAAYSADYNKPIWVRGPYAADATEADKEAKKTSYEYNARGLLVKITQPVEYDRPAGVTKAGIQEYEYDQYGRLIREKDASGRWTDTAYGENGQPIWCQTSKTRSTQPGGLNLRSTATCTAAGDVATATDAKGNVTAFTYDAMRRKTAETAPLGVQKRWIYDLDGNVEREGAWDGAAWKDVVSTYSPTGKVLTQTDPAGDQVKFAYDALDRILIKTDPEGRQVLTCYNAASQVLEEWRGTGLATSRCGQAVSQASATTPQRYIKNQYGGPAGAITASWDPNNNATTYAYQGLGKKITTYWPDGKFEHSLYNVTRTDGSITITRDREGRWNNNHFDKLGRPFVTYSQETPDVFNGSKIHINYFDSAGNLNWAGAWNYPDWRIQSSKEYDRDAAGRVYLERTYHSFPMDAAGNVTCWTCDASQVTYEYDANDNRTNMRWYQPDLTTIAKRSDYSYDALNRMTGIAFGDWGGANQGSVNYQYDTLGRRTKVTRGNGTSTDYAYENDGDLDWMRHLFQGGASATAANGNWVGIDYGYDKSGRVTLTSATDSRIMGALPIVGTYGAANNLNQVANVPGRAAMTWSDAGNLKTDGKGTTFTHDGRNRLKRAVKSDGTTLDFLYTVEGYRVESIRNTTGATPAGLPAGGTRTRFLLSGSEEVADLDANRNYIRYFVPGPAIDERVAQIEANGAVTYMHTDRQASVVAITDAAGNVVSRRGFGSYGETDGTQLVGTGSHPFGYTGRRWDPDLGIYYYRARWYDPDTGTFLQTDPIGSLDYINLYAYVGLDPVNATDPTGLECKPQQGGSSVCDPPGDDIGTFVIPAKYNPGYIGPKAEGYHKYDAKASTASNEKVDRSIEKAVADNPTPGNDIPATAEGVVNDAGISPFSGELGDKVVSFTTYDSNNNFVVLNVTIPGQHALNPGYVAQAVVPGENRTTVFVVGEGNARIQQGPGSAAGGAVFQRKIEGDIRRGIYNSARRR
jgi:RHS repeat-associated protein